MPALRFWPCHLLVAFSSFLLSASYVHGGELYFVLVFGAQRVPNRPNYSHSFATFVRASGESPAINSYTLEAHTISWLPETLEIRTLRLLPERGHNLDLEASLSFVASLHDRVSLWGPYQIEKEFYERALAQIDRLESGAVAYKAADLLYPSETTANCIHALSDVTGRRCRIRTISPGFGQSASYHIARRFQPWMINPCETHDWVAVCLGVDLEAVIRRRLPHLGCPPTNGRGSH